MVTAQNAKATQEFVPIREIRDGIIILRDGSMRAILLASSLNFSLKSSDEQTAIIAQFQNFLNALDFSVQIVIQSKKLDIRPYIALLEGRYKEQGTELMKIQTREYIDFVRSFVENSSIMTKSFYVVIPYNPSVISSGNNAMTRVFSKDKEKKDDVTVSNEQYEEHRSQLDQRVSVISQELKRCDIRVAQLGTEAVVELFYKIFNPGDTEKPIQIN
ncbi:MAG: hypothetical protein V4526_02230 [Patescibacteria group bacterium]